MQVDLMLLVSQLNSFFLECRQLSRLYDAPISNECAIEQLPILVPVRAVYNKSISE